MTLPAHIERYNDALKYMESCIDDEQLSRLPLHKREFYNRLKTFMEDSHAIITAKQDEVNHLKRQQLTTISNEQKYFSDTWKKFEQMYAAKGGDISLIRFW